MLALAHHLQTRFPQGRDHRGAVRDNPGLDLLSQVVGNEPPGVFLHRQSRPDLGGLDVGPMARLHGSRPLWIVRPAPAVLVVLPVPQCVKRLLPARCRYIQALARRQIAPRRQHLHVNPPARFAVLHRRPGVAIRFQPRPGGFLELVQHAADLRLARRVLRRPRYHPRGVLVLELQRVGHRRHLIRIAPQNFDFFRVLFLILRGESIPGEILRRRCRPSGSPSQKLDHHRGSPRTAKLSSSRSMATRCATTSAASAFPL